VQLGEVKSICDVLLQAKINSLDSLRRERVSEDDLKGPQNDYLPDKSVTNELAVLAPYEVSFHCFSSELAAVLAGFGSSPFGLLVKTINVEPAPAVAAPSEQPVVPVYSAPRTPYVAPSPRPPPRAAEAPASAEAAFAARYGLPGRGAAPPPARPVYVQPTYAPPVAQPANRGGLPLALDEKQLRVTLMLNVVKLVSPK